MGAPEGVLHHTKMETENDLEKQSTLGARESCNRLSLLDIWARRPWCRLYVHTHLPPLPPLLSSHLPKSKNNII